ncbi:MAG: DNA-deoxyinosine glycosylase [Christensenellales bacterium]|jgi:hypoxanthine-DNA glycosylase
MDEIFSFDPVINSDTRLLILGSMPGAASLRKRQYYGHERNYFWPIMSSVIGKPLDGEYKTRLNTLLESRVGLWDVIDSCVRPGSLDKDIINEKPNDIPALLDAYPGIRLLAFNGAKAAAVYKKYFAGLTKPTLTLPSTSPIPTKTMRSMEDRLKVWMSVRKELLP